MNQPKATNPKALAHRSDKARPGADLQGLQRHANRQTRAARPQVNLQALQGKAKGLRGS